MTSVANTVAMTTLAYTHCSPIFSTLQKIVRGLGS